MKATSPYLNRPCRSIENVLVARLARSTQNGSRNESAEQTLAELDHARHVIKPRRALSSDEGE